MHSAPIREMKKNHLSSRNSGTYTSPGTPDYNNVGGIQKGWCSERVPLPTNSSRRHISASALMPFNSGRTLPSKWDDAERWITSPVSGLGVHSPNPLVQAQRRPKSKSGPLGAPETLYYSNYSPAMSSMQGGSVRNFMAGSPFTTGVLVPDGMSIQYSEANSALPIQVLADKNITRKPSLPGWSDLLSESSSASSEDEKLGETKDSETRASPVISRRDMATQMSPHGSNHSSPKGKSSFCPSPPAILPIMEPQRDQSARLEIRDVQVDKRATVTRRSKDRGSPDIEVLTSSWEIAEAAQNTSKVQREEAKITAWENLQKAKAEAAIRKLEMKLEKKRSASMDRILNKLRISQSKAQEMRSSVSGNHDRQDTRASRKVGSLRKHVKLGSVRSCFTCHAL